jgi:hypothetical protein
MKDLLLSVEPRVAEHQPRQDDHIVEHTDFGFPYVKVAVVGQGLRPDASKIMFLVEVAPALLM